MVYPGSKYLRYAGCFPQHAAEEEHLILRRTYAGTLIARNQFSINETGHVVVFVKLDGIRIISRESKDPCLLPIHIIIPSSFYRSKRSPNSRLKPASIAFVILFVMIEVPMPLIDFFVFEMVALVLKRERSCKRGRLTIRRCRSFRVVERTETLY